MSRLRILSLPYVIVPLFCLLGSWARTQGRRIWKTSTQGFKQGASQGTTEDMCLAGKGTTSLAAPTVTRAPQGFQDVLLGEDLPPPSWNRYQLYQSEGVHGRGGLRVVSSWSHPVMPSGGQTLSVQGTPTPPPPTRKSLFLRCYRGAFVLSRGSWGSVLGGALGKAGQE